ncbi:MAG TPA: hypothetical protein VLB80_01540, partial [Candidatus Babeliales bacterium]|nr:hypothetical protein [Candidatus Babeliales bacterium]
EGNISLHKLDDTLSKFNTISLPKLRCYFCQYSPDGSYIVAGGDKKLFIIDTDAYSYKCLENKDDEIYCNIAFHPNNLILAILSEKTVSLSRLCVYKQQIVHYWDIKTQKFIIANMPVLKSSCGRDLSFSPDGLEMVIVLEGKCVRAPVPSAVNEKICQYLLFILHQLIEDAKLPEDVMLYCGNILLKTFAL